MRTPAPEARLPTLAVSTSRRGGSTSSRRTWGTDGRRPRLLVPRAKVDTFFRARVAMPPRSPGAPLGVGEIPVLHVIERHGVVRSGHALTKRTGGCRPLGGPHRAKRGPRWKAR